MVSLKYLTNFWRTLEMSLVNCEINLIIVWSANCVIPNAAPRQAITFPLTDTKLSAAVVTLSTYDNAKLLQQSKSRFKRTIIETNIIKNRTTAWPKSLFRLLDWSFQGVNRLFPLPFNANNSRIGHSRCYFPTAKIEDYNVMIDRKKRFWSTD